MKDEQLVLLGEIKGQLNAIQNDVGDIKNRLRKVEHKAAVNGGVTGTITGVITAIAVAIAKGPGGPMGSS